MNKEPVVKYDFRLSARKPFDYMLTGSQIFSAVPSPLDIHQAIHLGFVKNGKMRSLTRGRIYAMNQGDCYLIAPWEPHGILMRDHALILLFSISQEELLRSLLDSGANIKKLLQLAPDERMQLLNAPALRPLLQNFQAEAERLLTMPDEWTQVRVWHLLCSFFIDLDSQLDLPASPAADRRLDQALELIHQSNGQPVSLEDAATACSLGTSHFRHLFKDHFGISFGSYELQYRLNGAAESLLHLNRTIKETAGRWGFHDAAHFSRYFKKHYGLPPGDYQKNEINKKSQ